MMMMMMLRREIGEGVRVWTFGCSNDKQPRQWGWTGR